MIDPQNANDREHLKKNLRMKIFGCLKLEN